MLSIIIPTCNRNDLLIHCLNCLSPKVQPLKQTEYEVIVTDDGKSWETKQLIENNFPWVKWIAGPQKGPAANRNVGAKNTNGEWLVFIDDDCLPDKNLLQTYQQAIAKHPDLLVFEGCIKPDREQQSLAEESPINETGGHLWSCNFMISKNLFLKDLNGFDENFPYAAMEDVDLDYRITQNNIEKVFVKDAFVIHPWRLQKHMYKITKNRFLSTLYFLKKHPEKKKEISSKYYLIAFYNSFFKNTLKNAVRYRFKGFCSKITHDFMQLYFSAYMVIF